MVRKISLILLSICLLNNNVFAEANIIYAPVKQNIIKENVNNVSPKEQNDYIYDKGDQVAYAYNESTYTSNPLDQDYQIIIQKLYEDEHGNQYVLKADRQPVKNAWRQVFINNEYYWVFCSNNGRIVKGNSNRIKRCMIDNKPFAFNEYGKMLIGFFNESGEQCNDNEDPWDSINSSNLYYAGNNGVLVSGWQKYYPYGDTYSWKDNVWFYFDPKTHRSIKAKNDYYKLQQIGSKKYAFDSNGVMLTGMDALKYKSDSNESIKYFNSDGSVVTNGFAFLNLDDEVIGEKFSDYNDYEEDISIYLNKSGKMYKNIIKKINSDYYGFDDNGIVLKNCIGIFNNNFLDTISIDETDCRDFILNNNYINKHGESNTYSITGGNKLYYFDGNGRRQNHAKLNFNDDTYLYEANNAGAYEGEKSGQYYIHGILLKPRDTKYGIYIQNPTKNTYSNNELYALNNIYVIGTNGRKVKGGTSTYKDEDDNYWRISSDGRFLGIYSVKVRYGEWFTYNKEGKEEWIPITTTNGSGKYLDDYRVRLSNDHGLNININ